MLIPVLIALQTYGMPSKATSADTAYAISVLDSASAAMKRAEKMDYRAPLALVELIHAWRGHEVAWREASAWDASKSASEHYYKMWTLAAVIREGKRTQARDYLLAVPEEQRSKIITSLPNFMGNVPAEMMELLLPLLTAPKPRADYLYQRALALKRERNRAAALDTLRAAIVVMRNAEGTYPLTWAFEQMALGDTMAVEDILELAARESGVTGPMRRVQGMQRMAEHLRNVERSRAAGIADTLLRELGTDTAWAARWARSTLLQQRAAPGDSVEAAAMQSAMRKPSDPRFVSYDLQGEFYRSVQNGDSASLERTLDRWRGDSSAFALKGAVSAIRGRSAWILRRDAPLPPDEQQWTMAVIARLWKESSTTKPLSRDSARMEMIKVLAIINPAATLDSARTFSTPAQQDRARAEVIRRLVVIDAVRAERVASTLKDTEARDTAYAALVKTAIAGGRLSDARRFANAITQTTSARVSSRFALARMLTASGAQPDAIRELRQALLHMSPVAACNECQRMLNAPTPPPLLSRKEIVDIIILALQYDMKPEVDAWAASRSSDDARVWAWLTVAEAFSYVKLGRHPTTTARY